MLTRLDAAHLTCCLRLTGIPKLDDANDAGTKASEHCTLILTEGDSAKALAVAGLSVVGRNRYGVFPLRCGTVARHWPGGLPGMGGRCNNLVFITECSTPLPRC